LIANGVYGFHPFHWGIAYESFPSGHATAICAVTWILWLGYPRWRWWYAMVCLCTCAALVGMNYHFVGDVVAGVILGCVTGVWMGRLFRVEALRF
jgi:membrane-associated phospholipid phosphatase